MGWIINKNRRQIEIKIFITIKIIQGKGLIIIKLNIIIIIIKNHIGKIRWWVQRKIKYTKW